MEAGARFGRARSERTARGARMRAHALLAAADADAAALLGRAPPRGRRCRRRHSRVRARRGRGLGAAHAGQFGPIRDRRAAVDRAELARAARPARRSCVRLDPGLAFGTGSHPSTRLVLQWLGANHRAGRARARLRLRLRYIGHRRRQARRRRRRRASTSIRRRSRRQRDECARQRRRAARRAAGAAAARQLTTWCWPTSSPSPLIALAPLLAARTRARRAHRALGNPRAQAAEVAAAYARDSTSRVAAAEEGWALVGRTRGDEPHVTRCPNCGTAFRVQPAQLSARGGKVRCGKCAPRVRRRRCAGRRRPAQAEAAHRR